MAVIPRFGWHLALPLLAVGVLLSFFGILTAVDRRWYRLRMSLFAILLSVFAVVVSHFTVGQVLMRGAIHEEGVQSVDSLRDENQHWWVRSSRRGKIDDGREILQVTVVCQEHPSLSGWGWEASGYPHPCGVNLAVGLKFALVGEWGFPRIGPIAKKVAEPDNGKKSVLEVSFVSEQLPEGVILNVTVVKAWRIHRMRLNPKRLNEVEAQDLFQQTRNPKSEEE